MLKVWLHACGIGVASSRHIREDLDISPAGRRAQARPLYVERVAGRNPKAFIQVVEAAPSTGLGRRSEAIDSTRIEANAGADRSENLDQLRRELPRISQRIQRCQMQCNAVRLAWWRVARSITRANWSPQGALSGRDASFQRALLDPGVICCESLDEVLPDAERRDFGDGVAVIPRDGLGELLAPRPSCSTDAWLDWGQ